MFEHAGFFTYLGITIAYIFVGAQVDVLRMIIQRKSVQPDVILSNDKTTWLVVPFWPLLVIGAIIASPILLVRWLSKLD